MGTNSLPPDLQSTLETLFELFSAYVSSESSRERREIHSQILELFSRLGVVSSNPIVKRAAEMFEDIRKDRVLRPPRLETLALTARNSVNYRLRQLERQRNLVLSSGAKQVLRAPVVERAEFDEVFNSEQTYMSLETIFSTLQDEPRAMKKNAPEERTSIDVIRALWKNFCRIPPFCSEK
jgi:hypothetical protein